MGVDHRRAVFEFARRSASVRIESRDAEVDSRSWKVEAALAGLELVLLRDLRCWTKPDDRGRHGQHGDGSERAGHGVAPGSN